MLPDKPSEMLPDKPSEMLKVALNDLRACEGDHNYRVEMGVWYKRQHGVCSVCLAGAVMAKSLHITDGGYRCPSEYKPHDSKLRFLNYVREGNLDYAFIELGLRKPTVLPNAVEVAGYGEPGFYKDMRNLVMIFEELGI